MKPLLLLTCLTLLNCTTLPKIPNLPVREHSVQAVLWHQNAAEYKALCYQAFYLATIKLKEKMADPQYQGKPLAIITDIDETVLDNSPYAAEMIHKDVEYTPETWRSWVEKASAEAIPGAKAFLDYAHQQQVEIFYVSNRLQAEVPATMKNLEAVGFPNVKKDAMRFQETTGSKQARFEAIEKDYNVLLYLGDNLSDFSAHFRTPSTSYRNTLVQDLQDHFGRDYIVLPNASYGDWEDKGIYQGKHHWTPKQKDSIRKANVRP